MTGLRSRWSAVTASLVLAGAVLSGSGTPAQADWSNGSACAGYANGVGVTLYCQTGDVGGELLTLAQRFPGGHWTPCVDHEIPPGMRPPADKRDVAGQYWLQSCLDGVNFHTVTGGDQIEVTLGFHFATEQDAHNEDELSPLEDAVWDDVRSGQYPLPIMTAFPTHIPRVNVPTFFQFQWVHFADDGSTTLAQAPGTTGRDSDPYVHLDAGGASLTAKSVEVIVDPQIDGIEPKRCGPNPPEFEIEEEPDPDVQANDCYLRFRHSSAAAEELSTSDIPLPEVGEDYPLPVYVLKVTVQWKAEMQSGGQTQDLGVNDFVAYQQLPVTEVLGTTGLES